jgi:hypothetical protein
MPHSSTFSWILDSGGAGRGAWQGGVIHQLMQWTRQNGGYPLISMGASAGGYAAADVATETETTVMKGWSYWGCETVPPASQVRAEHRSFWGLGQFRLHLIGSIAYVMKEKEVDLVFNNRPGKKLLIFTTRLKRRDRQPLSSRDVWRYFLKSVTRKFPPALKYLPRKYQEDPVVFAAPLPKELRSEFVRPLTPSNYRRVIEASCLVPLAMGWPLRPSEVNCNGAGPGPPAYPNDENAVFLDGGFTLKMPMALFAEDPRFQTLARWAKADKTLVFCCDPEGRLWETSSRLKFLNGNSSVMDAIRENRLLVIYPDHPVEAGFLCHENSCIMRTFHRGQEQAGRLLRCEAFLRFLEISPKV